MFTFRELLLLADALLLVRRQLRLLFVEAKQLLGNRICCMVSLKHLIVVHDLIGTSRAALAICILTMFGGLLFFFQQSD